MLSRLGGVCFFSPRTEWAICKMLTNSQLFWVQPTPSSRHRALFVAITLSYVSPSLLRREELICATQDVGRNVCHGSDSVETAKNEIGLWFGKGEVIDYKNAQFDWIYEKP